MTYFNVDLKNLREPKPTKCAELIVGATVIAIGLLAIFGFIGCASLPDESDEISEMWSFAMEHKQYDRADSKFVSYVQDPAADCAKAGAQVALAVAAGYIWRGCTILGDKNRTILSLNPTAMELAHEAAHRVYGDWHPGYYYFTQRELAIMRKP